MLTGWRGRQIHGCMHASEGSLRENRGPMDTCMHPKVVLGKAGAPSGGVLPHPQSPEGSAQSWHLRPSCGSCPKAGCCVPASAYMMWGRPGEDSKHKPDEGGARGCLGAEGGPAACGWVTLYNYNTVVKAPEPGWRRAAGGGCWLPICSDSFRL